MKSIRDRIKELRKASNLTQEGLAEKLDISRDTVLRMENGSQVLTINNIEAIAAALNVGMTDILEVLPEDSSFRYLLRSGHREAFTKELKKCFEMRYEQLADVYSLMHITPRFLDIPHIPMESTTVSEAKMEANQLANDLRRLWDLGMNPIDDPVMLLESMGLIILEANEQAGDESELWAISGIKGENGFPLIILHTHKTITLERQRFTLIHELAHWIAHRDTFSALPPSAGRGRGRDIPEAFADQFAASFLVPETALKKLLRQHHYMDKQKGQALIFNLKKYFKVSYQVIVLRLIEIGYFDRKIGYIYFNKLRDKFKNSEPDAIKGELTFEYETSLLAAALEKEFVTEKGLLDLKFTPEQIQEAKARSTWLLD